MIIPSHYLSDFQFLNTGVYRSYRKNHMVISVDINKKNYFFFVHGDVHKTGALGRPRGMEWGGRREEGSGWGTHVYLWRIHFDIWQI